MITIEQCKQQYTLYQAALDIANKVAYDKSKGFSRSWDYQTYWEFASSIDKTIFRLEHQLSQYTFQPTLQIYRQIKWKKRKLYISTWQDKILETWLSKSLNKCLSKWFSPKSYAYQLDKLGINACHKDVISAIKSSKYVIRRDIKSFFYSINHQILLDTIRPLVDETIYKLLLQRISFSFIPSECPQHQTQKAKVGLPFGSPLACLLANIYLTQMDHHLTSQNAHYFRYADDFLIASDDPEAVLHSGIILHEHIARLKLQLHPDKTDNLSFSDHPNFNKVNRFKFLGLEYTHKGSIRLPLEKKRKIIGIFRRALKAVAIKINKIEDLNERLNLAISSIEQATLKRIRHAAIIDYYLTHTEDEQQLKIMDKEITEMVISTVLNKKFRPKDFKTIPYKKLRQMGLISLVHRSRMHKHGKINVPFLSIYNSLLIERYESSAIRRQERISQIRLARKLKKLN